MTLRVLVALAILCSAAAARAQQFSDIFVFGGSYSDAGTYLVNDESRRWTVNPAPVWNQLLGASYGIDVTPNVNVETTSPYVQTFVGGGNYAQGGARVSVTPGEAPYNTRSLALQLEAYLDARLGRADPWALHSLEGGGNDIFFWDQAIENGTATLQQAQAGLESAAHQVVDLANMLAEAGAGRILVLNIHDISVTPIASTSTEKQVFTVEVGKFNDRVETGLAALGRNNFILVDTYRFIEELVADGATYGFTNVTDPACVPADGLSLDCTTDTLVSPEAASTYLFSDRIHLTGPGHLTFYQYIQSLIEAPYLVGLTSEVPVADGRAIFRTFDQRLWDDGPPGWHVFGSGELAALKAGADESAAEFDGGSASLFAGIERRGEGEVDYGVLFSASHGAYDYSGDRGRFESNIYSGGAYATLNLANAFAQISGFAGYVDYPSIERHFDIYLGDRTNSGSTSGAHYGARILGGIDVDLGRHTLTPFAGLSYQSVDIHGYREDQNDSSTMTFGSQSREALFATIGARLACETAIFGRTVRSDFNFAFNHDFLDGSRDLIAGVADPGDILFATPLQTGSRNWLDAGVTTTVELGPRVAAQFAAGGQLGDNGLGQVWGRAGLDVLLQ